MKAQSHVMTLGIELKLNFVLGFWERFDHGQRWWGEVCVDGNGCFEFREMLKNAGKIAESSLDWNPFDGRVPYLKAK